MVPAPEVQWTTGNADEDQADATPNSPERPAREAQADDTPNSPERPAREAPLSMGRRSFGTVLAFAQELCANTVNVSEDQVCANAVNASEDRADATPDSPERPAPEAQLTTENAGEDQAGAAPNTPEGDVGILPADEKVSDDTKVPKNPRRSIIAMHILVFVVPCLAWITCVSLPAESNTKMFAHRVACSFGEGCERHLAGIQALQEPSNRLKEWLCANVPKEEEEELETRKGEEEIRQAEADAEQEKVSKEILATTKLDLSTKVVVGSFTGVLGSLAYIGWWPSHTKKV